jgi:hypothetical protein
MATANFTRGSRWTSSSLPGPPSPFPPAVRFKHSLPLHDAGPLTHLLLRQCLKLLDDIHDDLKDVGGAAHFDGLRAGNSIREINPRIRVASRMLRAYFEHDPYVSVGKATLILWDCQYDRRRAKRERQLPHW